METRQGIRAGMRVILNRDVAFQELGNGFTFFVKRGEAVTVTGGHEDSHGLMNVMAHQKDPISGREVSVIRVIHSRWADLDIDHAVNPSSIVEMISW